MAATATASDSKAADAKSGGAEPPAAAPKPKTFGTKVEMLKRRGLLLERAELLDKKSDSEPLSDEEWKEFDQALSEARELQEALARKGHLEMAKAKQAEPLQDLPTESRGRNRREANPEGGQEITKIILGMAAARGNPNAAAEYLVERFGESPAVKALTAGSMAGGGALIPAELASELIELLRPETVILELGAAVLEMPYGTLPMARQSGGATAAFTAEGNNATVSQQSFEPVSLVAKEIVAFTPVSNMLVRYSPMNVLQIVQEDLFSSIGRRSDLAFMLDDGTGGKPKGLRHQCATANVLTAVNTDTVANIKKQLGRLELALLQSNVAMRKPGWVVAPRTAVYLEDLVDGNGNQAFPSMEGMKKELRGYPLKRTSQLPITDGGGGNETQIMLADFADVMVGVGLGAQVDVSSEAAYTDAGGTMRSAFQRNETVIKVTAAVDILLRHPESCAWLTGVTWGAA